jgi:hypothetical protein
MPKLNLNHHLLSIFFCTLTGVFGVSTAFAQTKFTQLNLDMRALSAVIGNNSVFETPQFGGKHGALMQRALSPDAFRELNDTSKLPSPSNAAAVKEIEPYKEMLKLMTQRYERLFAAQPQKYGLEHLRVLELHFVRLLDNKQTTAPSEPQSPIPSKPLDASRQELMDSLKESKAKWAITMREVKGSTLKQVATYISTGAYVGEAKSAGQAFLTRYLDELKDVLTDAQQAEIKQLGGLS